MRDRGSPGPAYVWSCKCGLRLVAADTVELERRRGRDMR